jgi:hypothetical protein
MVMMKKIILLLFFASSSLFAFERRLLHPEFEGLMKLIENDLSVIEEGLKLGRRKEALEALYESRRQDLRTMPPLLLSWQRQVEALKRENQDLKNQLQNYGEETVCRVRLFGHEFIGLGANKSSASARAILLCAETYDYLLECSRARVVCP